MNYKGYWQRKLGIKEFTIPGGKGNDLKASEVDPEQMEKGEKVEKEHTKDINARREIASDHVAEDPKYYDKLQKAGLADELKEIDFTKKQQKEEPSMMKNGVLAISVRGTPSGGLPVKGAELRSNDVPPLEKSSAGGDYNQTKVMGERPKDNASMGGYEPIKIQKQNSEGTFSDTKPLSGGNAGPSGGSSGESSESEECPDNDSEVSLTGINPSGLEDSGEDEEMGETCPACNMHNCQCSNGNDENEPLDIDVKETSNLSDLVKRGEEETEETPERDDMEPEIVDKDDSPTMKEASTAYKVNTGNSYIERTGQVNRAREMQEDPTVNELAMRFKKLANIKGSCELNETIKKIKEFVQLHEGDKNLSSSKIGLLNKAKNVLSKWK